ncbi:MAG: hypothetical protein MJE63_10785 [Proteobacteria bacterium]|nr:hypothetical protein [Pseudomonadota bacterium]
MFLMHIPNDSNDSGELKTSCTDNKASHAKVKSVDFYLKKARLMRSDQAWRLVKWLFTMQSRRKK